MAMVDYGAILRVDGKIVNDSLFMEMTDTGITPPEKVHDNRYNTDINIANNYYVYAGDKDFMMVFYKCWFFGITQKEMIYSSLNHITCCIPWYTLMNDDFPKITVEVLTREKDSYYSTNWFYEDAKEELEEAYKHHNKKRLRELRRWFKSVGRVVREERNKPYWKNRFKASWDYKGKHYEVIYGYGIDPNRKVWDEIKFNRYDFSETERKIIDNWFEESEGK